MVDRRVDVLVVGGGLIGAVLMRALADSGFRCFMVDAQDPGRRASEPYDARNLALSPASQRILQTLELWPRLQDQVTPIASIHVSQQGSFGRAVLQADAQQALGFVVELPRLSAVLNEGLDPDSVLAPGQLLAYDALTRTASVQTPKATIRIQASLVVAADGTDSTLRRLCALVARVKTYPEKALLANVGLARDHGHQAFERFTPHGPLAVLPISGQRSALIWSLAAAEAERWVAAPETKFLSELHVS